MRRILIADLAWNMSMAISVYEGNLGFAYPRYPKEQSEQD